MPERRNVSLAAVKTAAFAGSSSAIRARAAATSSRMSTVKPLAARALADGSLVPATIAAALGAALDRDQPPLPALVAALGSRQLLVVLDNCEHLVAACAEVVERVVRACPRVHIVATSRESLGVAGEV